ncbi:MAG: Lrp/AsnC family transcriptional regulator [archaeon]|nr:Lrp/AsnC family transcriptional regulator [archaeon]
MNESTPETYGRKEKKIADFEGKTMSTPEIMYDKPIDLDKKDISLLINLDENARLPLSKLSKKIGLSRDAVKYRIERLIKHKIILKFTTIVNPPNFGFTNISWVFISLWNITGNKEEEFVKYLKNNPYITYLSRVGGRWDYNLEITARNPGHFDEILTNIRRKFPEIIRDYESVPLLKEYKMGYFPFRELSA